MEDDNKEIDIGEIRRLLCSIRTSGTKNIEPVKTLIGLLLEKDPEEVYLTKEECLLFYDAILPIMSSPKCKFFAGLTCFYTS